MDITMTISDPEWTVAGATEFYAEIDRTTAFAEECARGLDAWLANHVDEYLPGWQFGDGAFTGPARHDALSAVHAMTLEAHDYVVTVAAELAG